MLIRFDVSEVFSTANITGVYENAVKLVLPGFGPVRLLVEEIIEVDFKGEFEAIIGLREVSELNQ